MIDRRKVALKCLGLFRDCVKNSFDGKLKIKSWVCANEVVAFELLLLVQTKWRLIFNFFPWPTKKTILAFDYYNCCPCPKITLYCEDLMILAEKFKKIYAKMIGEKVCLEISSKKAGIVIDSEPSLDKLIEAENLEDNRLAESKIEELQILKTRQELITKQISEVEAQVEVEQIF